MGFVRPEVIFFLNSVTIGNLSCVLMGSLVFNVLVCVYEFMMTTSQSERNLDRSLEDTKIFYPKYLLVLVRSHLLSDVCGQ